MNYNIYNYKNWLLGVLTLLFCTTINVTDATAQDPRFSQINASSVFVNPAMTGLYEGKLRVGMNYRDQWSSFLGQVPFRTFGASLDYRFYVQKRDFFSMGLTLIQDEAGDSRLSMNSVKASFSYMKQLSGGRGYRNVQYLVAGAQLGYAQNSVNWTALRFSTQFDGSSFDPSIPTGEDFESTTNFYADFNAGLLWYALLGSDKSVYAGASVHHLNQPNISFLDNETETLNSTYIIHGGGEIPINRDASFLPVTRAMFQGNSYQIDFGGTVRFTTSDFNDVALRIGATGRIVNGVDQIGTDALTVISALEWDRWSLGMSYDITVSNLSTFNDGRGAFEISLTYIHPPSRRLGMYCPTF